MSVLPIRKEHWNDASVTESFHCMHRSSLISNLSTDFSSKWQTYTKPVQSPVNVCIQVAPCLSIMPIIAQFAYLAIYHEEQGNTGPVQIERKCLNG